METQKIRKAASQLAFRTSRFFVFFHWVDIVPFVILHWLLYTRCAATITARVLVDILVDRVDMNWKKLERKFGNCPPQRGSPPARGRGCGAEKRASGVPGIGVLPKKAPLRLPSGVQLFPAARHYYIYSIPPGLRANCMTPFVTVVLQKAKTR